MSERFLSLFLILFSHISLISSNVKRFPNHQIKAKPLPRTYQAPIKPVQKPTEIFKDKVPTDKDVDLVPLPRLEIYVRKYMMGFWTRLKGIPTDAYIQTKFQSLYESSGIEAEFLRIEIDSWISSQLYGDGLGGEKNFIVNVKNTLPRLKKLKPKDFEFGYKYKTHENEQEEYKEYSYMYSLENQERLRLLLKIQKSYMNEAPTILCGINQSFDHIYDTYIHKTSISSYVQLYQSTISTCENIMSDFYDKYSQYDVSSLMVVCDGSAYFQKDNCTKAGSGVYILPIDSTNTPIYKAALPIHIHNANKLVCTPFDAELLASLVAMTIIRGLIQHINTQTNINNTGNTDKTSIKKVIPSINVYTDSKTISKVFRSFMSDKDDSSNSNIINNNVPSNNNNDNSNLNKDQFTNNETSSTDKSSLRSRGFPSRRILWNILEQLYYSISQTTSSSLLSSTSTTDDSVSPRVSIEWIPGHPERRNSDVTTWTKSDFGIWISDNLSKQNRIDMNDNIYMKYMNKVSNVDMNEDQHSMDMIYDNGSSSSNTNSDSDSLDNNSEIMVTGTTRHKSTKDNDMDEYIIGRDDIHQESVNGVTDIQVHTFSAVEILVYALYLQSDI